jgi:hypothetical protein
VTGRRGRRSKQLVDDLKETRRGSTRSHSVERIRFGRGSGPVVRLRNE